MIVESSQIRLPLLPGQVARLELRAGSRLRSTAGTAWITMDGDPRDIVLGIDQEMQLDADSRVLACALRADGRAELRVCDPAGAELLRMNALQAGAPERLQRLPVDLIDRIDLDDGRAVIVRPVLPQDAEAIQGFFAALSPQSRHRRFHIGIAMLPASLIEHLTRVDHDRHVALVAQAPGDDGRPQLVAEARYVRLADAPAAEFALVVADAWQGQGLGRQLLQRLARHAARHGVQDLVGDVLHDNPAMLSLVRQLGARVGTVPGGRGLLRATFAGLNVRRRGD